MLAIVVISGLVGLSAGGVAGQSSGAAEPRTGCVRGTFPDYHDQDDGGEPPADYDGPVFALSQDYPEELPPAEEGPWQDVDVDAMLDGDGDAAEAYLTAAFDYATEGNIEADWVPADNPARDWYHTPWMDASADGREFAHGLTHELDSVPGLLGEDQSETAQTWAVGLYNAPGGWAIGQVWCDPDNPDPSALNPDDTQPNAFPDGTVVVKLLFTTADDDQAPFLEGTFEWTADIFETVGNGDPNSPANSGDPPRALQTVRLIQVDLAVRDTRLPIGWAFGTYAFDNASGRSGFDGLEPLGLAWGNSPGVTPTMVEEGVPLSSQWINETLVDSGLPDLHLGWGRRLSGPLDNPQSSCLSCHQTAGPPAAPLVPEASPALAGRRLSEAQRLGWFNDLPAGSLFSPDQVESLDYSLQLAIGLQRFLLATCDPRVTGEEVSARGPDRAAPAEVAPDLCDELAAPPAGDGGGDNGIGPGWLLGGVLAGVVVGALVATWVWTRRSGREVAATEARGD